MLGTACVRRQERQIEFSFQHRGQLDLGLLRRFLQTLQRHLILGDIHAGFLLELLHQPVDNPLIEVVAAQVRIAVGGFHLHNSIAYFQNRNIEGAAAEIVDRDGFVLLLIKAIGQRGSGRLIDDSHHFQAGNLSRVLGGLALRIVEIRRHRDHGFRDLFTQVSFRRFLQLGQNHGGDLGRRIAFAHDLDARITVFAGDDFVWY